MAYPEDCVPSPLPLRVFVAMLADGRCLHSTRTDIETPCFDEGKVPFSRWGAGDACVVCTAKMALAGRLTIGLIPEAEAIDATGEAS